MESFFGGAYIRNNNGISVKEDLTEVRLVTFKS